MRKALVSTGWAISLSSFSTNRCSLCRGSISGNVHGFQSVEVFAGWRALIIVSSLMSGCSHGHELKKSINGKTHGSSVES